MQSIEAINAIEDIQSLVQQGFEDWQQYGYVSARAMNDLLIFNYTPKAQYESDWNFFERVSRGLIINRHTGEVVARAFDKFFNWGEGGRKASGHIVTVTEKMDGSLGVLYRLDEGYNIATRGTFDSDQAIWATRFLNENYALDGLPNELTLLFEIIYPDNRIVVDYQGREDLVLLAARNRFTGDYLAFYPDVYDLGQRYGFSLPHVYEFNNVSEIIAQTDVIDENREGWVVEFADGSRFKFKGDRYLELHKLIFGLTFKWVLTMYMNNTLDTARQMIPDEFLVQVDAWAAEIEATISRIKTEVEAAFAAAPKTSRKDFALWVQANHRDLVAYLFAMLDGKLLDPIIYKFAFRDRVEDENN